MGMLPSNFLPTLKLRSFGWLKIPVLAYVRPSVVELSDTTCVIKIPLNRRTKNHLGSMYFGVLAVGADCAGGLIPVTEMERMGESLTDYSLVFKDFKADFLKRPDGDVHFTCRQGKEVSDFVQKAKASEERHNMPLKITATVPDKYGSEAVAEFILTLSLKHRKK